MSTSRASRFLLIAVLVPLFLLGACGKEDPAPSPMPSSGVPPVASVADIEGYPYPVVRIGNQFWMAENLRTTRYRNGDTIPQVTGTAWPALSSGAWCQYEDNGAYGAVYGKLYNRYAATDPRGLCPQGWRTPTDDDWTALEMALGLSATEAGFTGVRGTGANVGGKLKSTSTMWHLPNTGGTNGSGFSGLPSGFRHGATNGFMAVREDAFWWSASEAGGVSNGWIRRVGHTMGGVDRYSFGYAYGCCVRCIKE